MQILFLLVSPFQNLFSLVTLSSYSFLNCVLVSSLPTGVNLKILLDFDFCFFAIVILTLANLDCCQLRCDIISGIKKQLPVVFRSLGVLET